MNRTEEKTDVKRLRNFCVYIITAFYFCLLSIQLVLFNVTLCTSSIVQIIYNVQSFEISDDNLDVCGLQFACIKLLNFLNAFSLLAFNFFYIEVLLFETVQSGPSSFL